MKKLTLLIAIVAAFSMCALAQDVKSGILEVGDFDNAVVYNGSYFDMAPTTFYLAHTGVQMIYTPDVLTDLEGKDNVKITGLNFKFFNEGAWQEITRDVKIYIQETDATEFAVIKGIKQFFYFDDLALECNCYIDMLDYYCEDVDLPFSLADAPVAFTPGKSLLVTMVFDALDDDNCTVGSSYAPFYTSGIRSKAMLYTDNWISFLEFAQGDDFPDATAMLGCGTNVDLPLTRIEYTYTEGGTTSKRGDVNKDGIIDIVDVTTLIEHLLGYEVEVFDTVAANCDQMDDNLSVSDVTALINYLLNGTW
jgi:hypothetical protein